MNRIYGRVVIVSNKQSSKSNPSSDNLELKSEELKQLKYKDTWATANAKVILI